MLNFSRLWPFLLPALWLTIVTVLSTMPNVPLPKSDLFSNDKIAHLGVYGVLSWLILLDLRRLYPAVSIWRLRGYAFVFASAYGILMEFVQFAMHVGRMYEINDMLANATGAAIGVLFVRKK